MVGRKSAQAATRRRSRAGGKGARVARPARRRAPAGPPFSSLLPLVLLPALVTLGVTLLRLTGERMGWSPRFFSTLPGGGLAIVGITWLIPVVGFYLGDRLSRLGSAPGSLRRAAGLPLAGLALIPIVAAILIRAGFGDSPSRYLGIWGVASLVGMAVAWGGWPKLGSLLLGYALAARLPVVLVMWLAMRGSWGTHYDALPPGFPPMVPSVLWLWTGLVPQMTIWVALTVVVGSLFGVLAWHLAVRRSA
jgi:hypothetical protein